MSWEFLIFLKRFASFINNEVESAPSVYNIASKIAGLIDNTPLEMLMNKEARLILFEDSTSYIKNELSVNISVNNKLSRFKELAQVALNTLDCYDMLIEMRKCESPGIVMFTDKLAINAAQKLLKRANLIS